MGGQGPNDGSAGRVVEVDLEGELDLAASEDAEARIRQAEEDGPAIILIDLRKVTFIDSSGLRLILGAEVRAKEAGRRLVLVRGPERIQRVFQITGLGSRLEFVDHPSLLARPPGDG